MIRQIQLSTPVSLPRPPHTPPIQLSPGVRRRRLTGKPDGAIGSVPRMRALARANSSALSAPRACSSWSFAISSATVMTSDLEDQPRRVLEGILDGHEEIAKLDRKSTRLNSSHVEISYAVFC